MILVLVLLAQSVKPATIEFLRTGGLAGFDGRVVIHRQRQGSSDPARCARNLAQVLATNNFLELPAFFGQNLKVIRHLLTLAFGKKKSTLVPSTRSRQSDCIPVTPVAIRSSL